MPTVSRWMIRISLIYFVLSAAIGMCLLLNKAYPFYPEIWKFLPIHIELMIFGWLIQFTLGTAYWILPRFLKNKARGNLGMAITIPILLNGGIWLVVLSSSIFNINSLAKIGRILELLSVVVFITLHWKRIVSYNVS